MGYKDQARLNNSSYDYTTAANIGKAWRVCKIQGNNVYLTSTGLPLKFYVVETKQELREQAVFVPMRTISGTLTQSPDKTTWSYYRTNSNGFNSSTPFSLFPSICESLFVPESYDYYPESIRTTGYDYWCCFGPSTNGYVRYVKSNGSIDGQTARGTEKYIRPCVKLKATASYRDGTGTASSPRRLNEITY